MAVFGEIIWKQYAITEDDFGNPIPEGVWHEGYGPKDQPGICDSYVGAMALNMGHWEEYCDYHREKFNAAK